MIADYYINIFYLLAVWSFGWWLYFYSANKNWKLAQDRDLNIVYFLFLAFFVFLIIKNQLSGLFTIDHVTYFFFAVLLTFIGVNYIYFALRRNFKEPWTLIEDHPTDHWLEANRQSIFITSSHIIFQQIIITGLIIFLHQKFTDLTELSIAFAILFGLMHIPLFYFKGIKFALLYMVPALVAGFIFSSLLMMFEYGFILNYVIHWAFYAFLTFVFWYVQGKKIKTRSRAKNNSKI